MSKPMTGEKSVYFCEEPWAGLFSVLPDGTVRCCPCYTRVLLGNINENSIEEIWNAPAIVEMREAFADGKLPRVCEGQLCPVVSNQ